MSNFVKQCTWVIDSNKENQALYEKILGDRTHLTFFNHPREALIALLKNKAPFLIISELIFGAQCDDFREWVADFKHVPLLIISKFSNLDTIRELFKLGIKDFLTSPVDSNELLIKWELLLHERIKWESFKNRELSLGDTFIKHLTHKEFQMIQLFLSSNNNTVSRETLNFNIWGNHMIHAKTINVHIHNLRKKIKSSGHSIVCEKNGHWKLIVKKSENVHSL